MDPENSSVMPVPAAGGRRGPSRRAVLLGTGATAGLVALPALPAAAAPVTRPGKPGTRRS